MAAPVRFWLVLVRRVIAVLLVRSRAQLVALGLTAAAALLFLPTPWAHPTADAAKAQVPAREVVELRSARSKTIRQPDGTLRTTLSQQSLHHFDGTAKVWKEIDASFAASAKPGTEWESGDNGFSVDLASTSKERFLTLDTAAGPISLTLEDAAAVDGVKARDNVVTFKDAIENVDLEHVLLPDGLKESIVLRKPGAPSTYQFLLEPDPDFKLRAEEGEDGSIWFMSDDQSAPVFIVLAPVVGDSSDQALPQPEGAIEAPSSWSAATGKESIKVEDAAGGSFRVTLSIDEKWLSAPERVYLIVLDPTI